MLLLLFSVLLLIFGVTNLASEQAGIIGWLFVGIGIIGLLKQLSGPFKSNKHSKDSRGKELYNQTFEGSNNDTSSSDGGGGGE